MGASAYPLDERVDFLRLQAAAFRHLQLVAGLPHRLNQQALLRIAGHDGGARRATLEHSVPRIQAQAAVLLIGVAVETTGRENGTDLRFEEFGRGRPRLRLDSDTDRERQRREGKNEPKKGWPTRRMHADVLCTLGMAKSSAVLLAGLLVFAQASRAPKPGVKMPGVKIPIERLVPDAVFAVPGAPDWITVDEAVWISNKPKDSVARLDPTTNKVAATIVVGKRPCSGIASEFGSVWAPNCGDSTIARIDVKSGAVTATIKSGIGNSEGSIVAGAGSIWMMTDARGTLARFDPATNAVVAEIYVAPGSFGLAFGEDAVWVTSTEHHTVTRIDPHTNLIVETIPVGKAPRFIAVGSGAVWALNQGDGSVSRIDPKTNKVVATIDVGVPGGGGDIAVGEGSVWVTAFDFPISRIDLATNTVAQQFYGKGGDAIRVGLGSVWLSNIEAGTVWRLDPRRIEATLPD